MTASALSIADDKLRSATAVLAERERLKLIREALAPDLIEAHRDVAARQAALASEQKDVRRYERGVWAFLYDVFADREARLSKEQREAVTAELRLGEAVALRDRLEEEVASLTARIDARAQAEFEVELARVEKEAVVIASGGTGGAALVKIGEELAKIEPMAREFVEAIAAGQRAHTALTELADVLGSASNWGTADLLSDSFFISWVKRNKLDEAQRLAGLAQAEVTLFARELRDVGLDLNAEITTLANHHRFLDTWFDNLFTDFSVQRSITSAQATTRRALEVVAARLDELRRTLEALQLSTATLMEQRLALIA